MEIYTKDATTRGEIDCSEGGASSSILINLMSSIRTTAKEKYGIFVLFGSDPKIEIEF